MLVWALLVLSVMTLLSFMGQLLFNYNISEDAFRYIGPMAVGFIIVAAWRIGKKVVKDRLTFYLLAFGAIITYVIREPWIFPLVLLIGVTAVAGGLIVTSAFILMQKKFQPH